MTASLHPPPEPAQVRGRGGKPPTIGIREQRIEGGFIKITPMQMVMAWWLHLEGHLTRRQLRIWFAAHEMLERRRHQNTTEGDSRPLYGVEEIQALVGGRGSQTASAEFRSELKHLSRLNLVHIEKHSITFAQSIDQICVDDISGFWSMWNSIPNQRRTVPVPRRTLRALAGGFSRAVTGVMIALLLRGVFWHKEQGDYRCDARTKLSWIADVFGVSRRAVTDARTKLIELGWIEPLECSQWELNKWGVRDRIRTDWSQNNGTSVEQQPADPVRSEAPDSEKPQVESASPNPEIPGESASPLFNKSLLSSKESLNTRRLEATAPNPVGVCNQTTDLANGKKKTPSGTADKPSLRNIQAHHLRRTEDLLQIYTEAVDAGLVSGSEAGRLDFVALAERACAHGSNPGGLLRWLLTNRKFEFITQADEEAAVDRLKQYDYGTCDSQKDWKKRQVDHVLDQRKVKLEITSEEKFVMACLKTAKMHRIEDPFYIALEAKGWSRDEWDEKRREYELRQVQRWTPVGEGG